MFKKLIQINTIDYDYSPKYFRDKITFETMIKKIQNMPCCEGITTKDSELKGKHVIIECAKIQCDLCRFLFDDTERYRKDIQRPKYARNVLLTQKNTPLNVAKKPTVI